MGRAIEALQAVLGRLEQLAEEIPEAATEAIEAVLELLGV